MLQRNPRRDGLPATTAKLTAPATTAELTAPATTAELTALATKALRMIFASRTIPSDVVGFNDFSRIIAGCQDLANITTFHGTHAMFVTRIVLTAGVFGVDGVVCFSIWKMAKTMAKGGNLWMTF